jgi:hypothetical protein
MTVEKPAPLAETEPAPKAQTQTADAPDVYPRRSFPDITANPCFAHAPDYSSLTGELQHYAPGGSWRLRFAPVDEDDTYGGSVTLVGGHMDGYKNGQMVRVSGHLADPDNKVKSPVYLVARIEALATLP